MPYQIEFVREFKIFELFVKDKSAGRGPRYEDDGGFRRVSDSIGPNLGAVIRCDKFSKTHDFERKQAALGGEERRVERFRRRGGGLYQVGIGLFGGGAGRIFIWVIRMTPEDTECKFDSPQFSVASSPRSRPGRPDEIARNRHLHHKPFAPQSPFRSELNKGGALAQRVSRNKCDARLSSQ